MPFKHFLTTSLDFERTHQLILQCLLNDPLFLEAATGVKVTGYSVVLEPEKGMFDIGILDHQKEYLCLIELKMWSSLSRTQLERQRKFLENEQCLGVHILLGTSDLQYYRDENYDDIAEETFDHSSKVGYRELISLLERFIALQTPGLPIAIIANDYKEALSKQFAFLDNAWLDENAYPHFRAYSVYNKIRTHLLDERFYIYSVHNAGGADHILNDDDSWTKFRFKNHEFEMYLEMLNCDIIIRVYSDGVPNDIRRQLKDRVMKELKKKYPFNIPWSFDCKASKYYKLAVYRPELKTLQDCEKVAEMLKGLNPLIKDIARSIKDKEKLLEPAGDTL